MESNIVFKTKNKNTYIFNRSEKVFLSCHPIIEYIINLVRKGICLDNWINELKGGLDIEGYCYFHKDEVLYYYSKYKFLHSKGLLKGYCFNKNIIPTYTQKKIESLIANCDSITFEVTERCNLNCKYCTYGVDYDWYDKRENNDLSYYDAISLLNYYIEFAESSLNNSKKSSIEIGFYGGEPLLRFDFIEKIVTYVKSLNLKRINVTFGLTTNALLLKKYSSFLVKNNFQLTLSLDGDEKHNAYRVFHDGKQAFGKIVENILYLKNNYPNYFDEKVLFNSVFHDKSRIDEIFTFFKETFNKYPILSELDTEGVRADKKNEFEKIYQNVEKSVLVSSNRKYIEEESFETLPKYMRMKSFLLNNLQTIKINYNQLLKNIKTTQPLTGTCAPFEKRIFLTVSGKIMVCENVNHRFYVGKVNDEKVYINYDKIMYDYNKFYRSITKQCSTCYLSNDCNQCVFFIKDLENMPRCTGYLGNYKRYSEYLSEEYELIEEEPGRYCEIMSEK